MRVRPCGGERNPDAEGFGPLRGRGQHFVFDRQPRVLLLRHVEGHRYDALLVAAAVEFADKALGAGRILASEFHLPCLFMTWRSGAAPRSRNTARRAEFPDRGRVGHRFLSAPPVGRRSAAGTLDPRPRGRSGHSVQQWPGLTRSRGPDQPVRSATGWSASGSARASPTAKGLARERHAFTAVPFDVTAAKGTFVESTVRSRGFKFALVSGIAAYLAGAGKSSCLRAGRASVGPSLVTVGQAYEDYRSHPLFTCRMETFLEALLGYRVGYVFPQIWQTKGRPYVNSLRLAPMMPGRRHGPAGRASAGQRRRSKRQCGVCAACMLRRMSVHAAGLTESPERYVWERLTTRAFEDGAEPSFRAKDKISGALREYAIAGALHLDHLAELADGRSRPRSRRRRFPYWRSARSDASRRAQPA